MAAKKKKSDAFLESLMDTNLYSMGAYFSDTHPDLVDEVIQQSVAIEERGLASYSADNENRKPETRVQIDVDTASSDGLRTRPVSWRRYDAEV